MNFRADINGLRAYAVLAVMVFHFDKLWLPGGFAGVDVFFVISGFLMTGIIFRRFEADNFSIFKFYSDRVRRIIPALLFLVIVLLAFGYVSLAPITYASLAKHAESSLLFISNIVYWHESGYFDASALEKFLLHTWSLSVEWQFYLIYPLLLWTLRRFVSICMLKKLVLIATVLSFFISIYLSYQWPTVSYFLLPARIWEMLCGGVAFLFPFSVHGKIHKRMLEGVGILFIITSFFVASEHTIWPGYFALLPVTGAFLLIQANGASVLTNNIVFQKIGFWSYSLYLWHWPILVVNHLYSLELSFGLFLILTLICGVASYYLIERRKWKTIKVLCITGLVLLLSYFLVHKTGGADYRVPSEYSLSAKDYHAKYYGGANYPTHKKTVFNASQEGGYDYVLIGDSFARQYASYLTEEKIAVSTWFADGCIFFPNYTQSIAGKIFDLCKKQSDQLFQTDWFNESNKPIIWAQYWQGYSLINKQESAEIVVYSSNPEKYTSILRSEVKTVLSHYPNKKIFLVGETSPPSYHVYNCQAEKFINRWRKCPEFSSRNERPINTVLREVASEFPQVEYISPNEVLCEQERCKVIVQEQPVFSDAIHLSIYGGRIVGNHILQKINEYIAKDSH